MGGMSLGAWGFAPTSGKPRLAGEHGGLYVKQRDVDALPLPRDVPMVDRSEDGGGGVQRGHQVNHCHADFLWCAVRFARDAHSVRPLPESARRSQDGLCNGAALPKACDGTVNNIWVDLLNAGVVQAVFFQVPIL